MYFDTFFFKGYRWYRLDHVDKRFVPLRLWSDLRNKSHLTRWTWLSTRLTTKYNRSRYLFMLVTTKFIAILLPTNSLILPFAETHRKILCSNPNRSHIDILIDFFKKREEESPFSSVKTTHFLIVEAMSVMSYISYTWNISF